jgi:hypothetical protein
LRLESLVLEVRLLKTRQFKFQSFKRRSRIFGLFSWRNSRPKHPAARDPSLMRPLYVMNFEPVRNRLLAISGPRPARLVRSRWPSATKAS